MAPGNGSGASDRDFGHTISGLSDGQFRRPSSQAERADGGRCNGWGEGIGAGAVVG